MKFNTINKILLSSLVASANAYELLRDYAEKVNLKIGVAANTNKFNNGKYNEALKAFNIMVAENGCKLSGIQQQKGRYNFNDCDAHYNKAKQLGMQFRGHTLIWHSYQPSWFENADSNTLRNAIVDHITKVLQHYEGKIGAWDVVNEAVDDSSNGNGFVMRNSFLRQKVPDFVDLAFKTARKVSPNTKLFYNDYNAEGVYQKAESIYNFVKDLKNRGIPIDGVGLQYHVSVQQQPQYNKINSLIQRYCALGLEVHITEMDVSCENCNSNSQSEVFTNAMKACLANSCCSTLIVWGVGDNDSWIGGNKKPLLFDGNYQPKAQYTALLNLLKGSNARPGSGSSSNNSSAKKSTKTLPNITSKTKTLPNISSKTKTLPNISSKTKTLPNITSKKTKTLPNISSKTKTLPNITSKKTKTLPNISSKTKTLPNITSKKTKTLPNISSKTKTLPNISSKTKTLPNITSKKTKTLPNISSKTKTLPNISSKTKTLPNISSKTKTLPNITSKKTKTLPNISSKTKTLPNISSKTKTLPNISSKTKTLPNISSKTKTLPNISSKTKTLPNISSKTKTLPNISSKTKTLPNISSKTKTLPNISSKTKTLPNISSKTKTLPNISSKTKTLPNITSKTKTLPNISSKTKTLPNVTSKKTKTLPNVTSKTKTLPNVTSKTKTLPNVTSKKTKTLPNVTSKTKTLPGGNGKCTPVTVTVTVTVNGKETSSASGNCATVWNQCGGRGFSGPTCCESGTKCKKLNDYYHQCIYE